MEDQSAIIASLLRKVDELTKRVEYLEKVEKENILLRKENAILKEKLSKYEKPKNSRNSSVPPSKDENRPLKNKSLRESSGRKPGGQPGHEGSTLKMTETPDEIIKHIPSFCGCCGSSTNDLPSELVGKRQVVDIPPVKPIYTEHRIYQKKCACGYITKSDFPENVTTSISYGANIESLVGYWFCRQYIPFDRMKEIFHDIFSLPVSEGGLHHILNRLSTKALPAYNLIKEKITSSTVVGVDETGMKINGKKCWGWSWQNESATFIVPSENRGFETIKANFDSGFPNAILVHDCWKSHFQTHAQSHQVCIAHLFRELNYFIESDSDKWAINLKKLFQDAIELKRKMEINDYKSHYPPRESIKNRLDDLLNQQINEKNKGLLTFKKRMLKYKEYLFEFLHYPDVPADNNGSERAIRNIKVKQKISGQFKSMIGAINFSILRSITDTAIKNGQNVLNALFVVAKLKPTD